jgi:cell pole-organizing protein PopZ
MSKPAAKVPEPSMEEILASIRRIISDESNAPAQPAAAAPAPAAAPKPAAPAAPAAKKAAPPPPPPPAAEAQEEPDVLELTEIVEAKPAPRAEARPETRPEIRPEIRSETRSEPEPRFESQDTFRRTEPDVMFRDAEPMREPARYAPAPAPRFDENLISQQTSAQVASAFGALGHQMLGGDSRTIDELVREMLRPMLKSWLDDNLPSLVERLVRAEIERVSRGR